MRLNKYLAQHTELSRRRADDAISEGRVLVNGAAPDGNPIGQNDNVTLDGTLIISDASDTVTILMNKPVGFVCSRDGQGSRSVYSLLPEKYQRLNIAGRLDKDSSGLILLTNDGDLLQQLTHPSSGKTKTYEITLQNPLSESDIAKIKNGIDIGDERLSKMTLKQSGVNKANGAYTVVLEEGRNRQIRRSFGAINHRVLVLHRTKIGQYHLGNLQSNKHTVVK